MSEPLDALEQARTRLRLGKALFDQGETDGAIPVLQPAKCDPTTRLEAGYYLGYCFLKKKSAKLAINELQAVIAGAPTPLTDVAKSAAYLLGRIYEQAGRKEQAVDAYRLISPDAFPDLPRGGTAGSLAPLRPGDPPRRPPDPPSVSAGST
jgi:tetratricopeptide (TPR) repeat protein